jgi:hypothetical protein
VGVLGKKRLDIVYSIGDGEQRPAQFFVVQKTRAGGCPFCFVVGINGGICLSCSSRFLS